MGHRPIWEGRARGVFLKVKNYIFVSMAKSKSKKSQKPAADKLRSDKESRVTAKELVKDERTHKITGAVFLLLALFLFIAFTSFLFTWQDDQDKVLQGVRMLWSRTTKTANLLATLAPSPPMNFSSMDLA